MTCHYCRSYDFKLADDDFEFSSACCVLASSDPMAVFEFSGSQQWSCSYYSQDRMLIICFTICSLQAITLLVQDLPLVVYVSASRSSQAGPIFPALHNNFACSNLPELQVRSVLPSSNYNIAHMHAWHCHKLQCIRNIMLNH